MNHLLRSLAPIGENGWHEIEEEATRSLRHFLAARKLVDYSAEGGWERAAVNLGRTDSESTSGIETATRRSSPMAELRVPFAVSRAELGAASRGAGDMDTQPIINAARAAAEAEDAAIFRGNSALGIRGIGELSPYQPVQITESLDRFPHAVAKAIDLLAEAGVAGPYGIALGPQCWRGVMESSESGGYPLLKHVRLLLEGPAVWAPSLEGAVVVSQRGGDYEISGGQDWAIGYRDHDTESVNLYLEETVTFVVNTPEAAVTMSFA